MPELSFYDLSNQLIVFWGGYVFLMAIGVSEDLINPKIALFCSYLAQEYFVVGLAITIVLPISVAISDLLYLVNHTLAWVAVPIGLVLLGLLILKLRRRPSVP